MIAFVARLRVIRSLVLRVAGRLQHLDATFVEIGVSIVILLQFSTLKSLKKICVFFVG